MQSMKLARARLATLAVALLPSVARSDVVIVDATGTASFSNFQAAVDAAVDGDVLLASRGTYQGFTIDGKALSVFAAPANAVVKIVGPVRVSNLAADQDVILVGLDVRTGAGRPISASSISGHLRVQDCRFDVTTTSVQAGASLTDANVVFTNCTVQGGTNYNGMSPGIPGANGLEQKNSWVALYDSTVSGGSGYYGAHPNTPPGAKGGDGIRLLSNALVFTTKSTVNAGAGGQTSWQAYPLAPIVYGSPGPNGAALFLGTGNVAYSLDSSIGAVSGPGVLKQVPGPARQSWVRTTSDDQAPVTFSASGLDGDEIFLRFGSAGGFFLSAQQGVWTVKGGGFTLQGSEPLGVVNSSGSLNGQVFLPALPPSEVKRRYLVQGYAVDSSGHVRFATPSSVLSLNGDSLPDCNGNGIQDYWETIDDSTLDLNNNFIPDECEPGAVSYVDAQAASGGTGTAAAPFKSIGEAVAQAGLFGTVIVADGVYVGANNHSIDLGAKCLALRSVNGPENCIIDCDFQGRAFSITVPEGLPSPTLIEGFTIQRGMATDGGAIYIKGRQDVILRNNRFRRCVATSGGGALRIEASRVLVEGCVLRGNRAQSVGGGAYIGTAAFINSNDNPVSIVNCVIESNVSGVGTIGGGLYFYLWNNSGSAEAYRLSHSIIRGNTGGGIFAWQTRIPLYVDNCLITGNTAPQGAGFKNQTTGVVHVTNSTIADNHASVRGGGIDTDGNGGATFNLYNTVVWGNTAPAGSGPQMYLAVGNVDYCLVEGGQAMVQGNATWGPGNIAADPLFANPGVSYRLSAGSPAIDAGNNAFVPADRLDVDANGNALEPVPLDLDLRARHVDVPSVPDTGAGVAPIVDIGTYERHP